ncbi:hypothetical protein FRC12_022936 [Ceratobasidium sp. 428]|nr:hypothetical protein FRC12_022936 [Ceratobasidium sp. 428]
MESLEDDRGDVPAVLATEETVREPGGLPRRRGVLVFTDSGVLTMNGSLLRVRRGVVGVDGVKEVVDGEGEGTYRFKG